MAHRFELMNEEGARTIMQWQYPKPYEIYSFSDNEETFKELMSGTYFMVTDHNKIIGYFCYGISAQIPIEEAAGSYEKEDYLDIGLGLKPSLCGLKYGSDFLESGIAFLSDTFKKKHFRLTVWSDNVRAIKVYEAIGFKKVGSFTRNNDHRVFNIMTKVFLIYS